MCIYIHIYINHTYVCIYKYINTFKHMNKHIHTHSYINKYILIYIRTYTSVSLKTAGGLVKGIAKHNRDGFN